MVLLMWLMSKNLCTTRVYHTLCAVVYQHSCSCLFSKPSVSCCSVCFTFVPAVHPSPLSYRTSMPLRLWKLSMTLSLPMETGKERNSFQQWKACVCWGSGVRRRGGKGCIMYICCFRCVRMAAWSTTAQSTLERKGAVLNKSTSFQNMFSKSGIVTSNS